MNELIERYLELELKIVNRHLPYSRISLCEALRSETPEVVLRDGSTHRFDRRELIILKEVLGEDFCDLMLPIFVYYDIDIGKGTYRVRGKREAMAVARLLGKEENEEIFLTRAELIELRSRLRTTTTIVFISRRAEETGYEY